MNMIAIHVKLNFLTRYLKYPYRGEQPKLNIDEGYVMFILLFGIPCLMIVFVFMQPLPDFHINLPRVS